MSEDVIGPVIGAVAEPHPEGNPALAAAVQAILNRRLAASHGMGDETSRRAALLLEILPDAAVALEAVAPLLAAAERERIKAARAVSACCGAEYHREPGRYGRWQCHACDKQCDLIGTIG